MATTPQHVTTNGAIAASETLVQIQDISVEYNNNNGVTVVPEQVNKGTTVRFKDPTGGKVRIVFLSPMGKETDTVLDSELYTLTVGGAYHFKCYFTLPGAKSEISPQTGGVIDVLPHRP